MHSVSPTGPVHPVALIHTQQLNAALLSKQWPVQKTGPKRGLFFSAKKPQQLKFEWGEILLLVGFPFSDLQTSSWKQLKTTKTAGLLFFLHLHCVHTGRRSSSLWLEGIITAAVTSWEDSHSAVKCLLVAPAAHSHKLWTVFRLTKKKTTKQKPKKTLLPENSIKEWPSILHRTHLSSVPTICILIQLGNRIVKSQLLCGIRMSTDVSSRWVMTPLPDVLFQPERLPSAHWIFFPNVFPVKRQTTKL